MADAAETTLRNELYEQDFYAWTQEQARLLRERRWDELDLENLVDEVGSVGISQKREIESRTKVIITHMLKWKYQPGLRNPGWAGTLREQRDRLFMVVRDSPSLRLYSEAAVVRRYLAARLLAAKETGIAFGLFPEEFPFTPEQVFDPEFFPEDRSIE